METYSLSLNNSTSPDSSPIGRFETNPYKRITRRIDSMKVRHNQKKDIDVNISLTQELNIALDTAYRAGAIIYTQYNNTTYFCLGVDTQSGNLTDFGGGVKKGETIVEGGLRELDEESQGVFGEIGPDDIEHAVIFHSYNMAIMFIPLEINPREVTKKFITRVSEYEKNEETDEPEVCDITWLTTEEFLESIHGRGKKLYIRVRKLLSKVTSTITEL